MGEARVTTHNSEHQQHIEDFDALLREQPARSADTVSAVINFARTIYDPHADTSRFSALVEGLHPLAEKHNRLYFEREMERLMRDRNA